VSGDGGRREEEWVSPGKKIHSVRTMQTRIDSNKIEGKKSEGNGAPPGIETESRGLFTSARETPKY